MSDSDVIGETREGCGTKCEKWCANEIGGCIVQSALGLIGLACMGLMTCIGKCCGCVK